MPIFLKTPTIYHDSFCLTHSVFNIIASVAKDINFINVLWLLYTKQVFYGLTIIMWSLKKQRLNGNTFACAAEFSCIFYVFNCHFITFFLPLTKKGPECFRIKEQFVGRTFFAIIINVVWQINGERTWS